VGDAQFFLPGLNDAPGLDAFWPTFQHGLINGAPQVGIQAYVRC
jgi:hypothetical protein